MFHTRAIFHEFYSFPKEWKVHAGFSIMIFWLDEWTSELWTLWWRISALFTHAMRFFAHFLSPLQSCLFSSQSLMSLNFLLRPRKCESSLNSFTFSLEKITIRDIKWIADCWECQQMKINARRADRFVWRKCRRLQPAHETFDEGVK